MLGKFVGLSRSQALSEALNMISEILNEISEILKKISRIFSDSRNFGEMVLRKTPVIF